MIARLRPHLPLIAFLTSGALLAGAHAFETFGHMAPCAMCLQQREAHWAILGLAAFAFIVVRVRPQTQRLAALLIGAAFLWSVYRAGMHVAVEHHWIPAQCEAPRQVSADSFRFDPNAQAEAPRCDIPAWTMFGVSMAGYNGLISLALAALSFVVALAPGPKKANG